MRTYALIGVAGSLVAAGAATAGFLGLEIADDFRGPGGIWDANGYAGLGLTTYRIYATFDGLGDDGVLAVFGQPGDNIRVASTDGLFHNTPLFDSNSAPLDLTFIGIWDNQWDTYVTIGKTDDDGDQTKLSAGFGTITNNLASNWSDDNVGWFVTPPDAQSEGTHVLIAQFVVAAGEKVFGSVNILTRENETFKGLQFPAPSVLALLGLAGVARTRRRC